MGPMRGNAEQGAHAGRDRPVLAVTTSGPTLRCVEQVRRMLEAGGYEVRALDVTAGGGRALEALVDAGAIRGVADVTTGDLASELMGGTASSHRLDAAARAGIPQVVSLGGLDMLHLAASDTTVPRAGRLLHDGGPGVTLARTTPGECAELGTILARKLAAASGPTTLLVPLYGMSALSAKGGPFHAPYADEALLAALRRHLDGSHVRIVELDYNLNDPTFANTMAARLLVMLEHGRTP